MDYIRTCDVYPTTRCNCPERTCRREKSELEALESERNIKLASQRRFEDLLDFQFYLNDNGYINNYDWDFQELAIRFINQKSK